MAFCASSSCSVGLEEHPASASVRDSDRENRTRRAYLMAGLLMFRRLNNRGQISLVNARGGPPWGGVALSKCIQDSTGPSSPGGACDKSLQKLEEFVETEKT